MCVAIKAIESYVPRFVLNGLERAGVANDFLVENAEHMVGAVLFSDISGFTALAERLALHGPAGAEQLSELLNRYFGQLIALITEHGGDVLKLAGDSLLALWPATDEPLSGAVLRAARCALTLQVVMEKQTEAEGICLLSKVGIGAGEIVAMRVGGVLGRWELLISGDPLVQCGLAEGHAHAGEVVLSAEAWSVVSDACRGTLLAGDRVRLGSIESPLQVRTGSPPGLPPQLAPSVRPYIPGAILTHLDAGLTDWLAELRPITALFLNLPDLDVTTLAAQDRAREIFRALQTTLYRHEGSVNKLSVDEKGLTLVAAMGLPPLAHGDDAARGLDAALEMHETLRNMGVRSAIGVTTGRVYCGEIGGTDRREYTIIGDQINLAARLMQLATESVLCDAATRQATRGRFAFEALPPVAIKGKAYPIPVFRPIGHAATSGGQSPLFGRTAEREILRLCLADVLAGKGRRVIIEGEAGIGKSRLVIDVVGRAQSAGVTVLAGQGDAVEKSTPYYAWRAVVAQLLGVDDIEASDERRERALERLGSDPELLRQAPLLNDFLPLDLSDNELTVSMVGRVRAENTHDLLIRLIDDAVRLGPTALVLEDAQWLDSASWALMLRVSRRIPSLMLIVSMRPIAESVPADYRAFEQSSGIDRLTLGALTPDEALALVSDRLGVDALPPAAADLIVRKAQGNPFFCQELAYALRDLDLIQIEAGTARPAPDVDWTSVALPDSIQGVIANRIDRLQPTHQLTLKVSSVIGRVFPVRVLHDVFPIEPERPRLPQWLDELTSFDFTLLETPEPDLAYLFKHVTIQEVSYDMLLFAHRRQLHQGIARWYEQTHADDLAPYYSVLAHHWRRAEVAGKAIDYLEVAGLRAMRGGAYQDAVAFLGEAIRLDDATETQVVGLCGAARRARWRALLGEAYLGLGRLAESREHTMAALRMFGHPLPTTRRRLFAQFPIELARQARDWLVPSWFTGKSREAIEILRWSSRAHDVICQVCYYSQDIALGTFCALRALNLAKTSGPCPELARSYGTMCVIAGMVPLHSLAEAYGARAWKTVEAIEDMSTRAWVSQMLGMYWLTVGRWDKSRERLTEAVESTRRIGDWRRWEESLVELARLEYLQGDFALGAKLFGEVLRVALEYGHEQVKAWCLHGQSTCLLRAGRLDEVVGMIEKSPALESGYSNVADTILGLGLLALARLRVGQNETAGYHAEEALKRIERTRPMANFNMEGYAATAEVFLGLWESSKHQAAAATANLRTRALVACKALRQFARIFPMAQPRAWTWWGWFQALSGRPSRARASWRVALQQAERLAMCFEQGLVHYEIGRHECNDASVRRAHLEQARVIFERLGAVDDLRRLSLLGRPSSGQYST